MATLITIIIFIIIIFINIIIITWYPNSTQKGFMACGHIIKQSFNQFCCQRIHSGIITILQIQFRCLLQTRDFHIKKTTLKNNNIQTHASRLPSWRK